MGIKGIAKARAGLGSKWYSPVLLYWVGLGGEASVERMGRFRHVYPFRLKGWLGMGRGHGGANLELVWRAYAASLQS